MDRAPQSAPTSAPASASIPDAAPDAPSADGGAVLFDARLMPHRSLPPVGFALLMGAISLLSFGAGLTFYLIGAWPIVGFLGLDVLLIYIAFKVSFRRMRAFETLRLTEAALVYERVNPAGVRRRWTFQPYWLRIEYDDPPDHGSQLRLRSHGRSVTVGAFLPPPARESLAAELRQALRELKNPVFDQSA